MEKLRTNFQKNSAEEEFLEDDSTELYEHYRIVADKGQSLMRIDKFLAGKLEGITRSRVQNAIEAGLVLVNGKVTKANYKVKPADTIVVNLPKPPRNEEVLPENIPLDIVYEDEDLVIINKPAGMVVHPALGNWSGTLVNALLYHFQQLPYSEGNEIRPGLVHRIDKDTSGLIVVAKNEKSLSHLAKQFFDHTIERTYLALVWGEPKQTKGTIDSYIGRSKRDRKIMDVFEADEPTAKRAITHYEVVKSFGYVSLLKCNLETGRTHQIRVHLKSIGHPLFADSAYGGDKILKGLLTQKYKQFVENCFKLMSRQALHAQSLGFLHPTTRQKMFFESPLPADFQAVLEKWENYVLQKNLS
ncbi:MAG: RluA family pseudouridine synthase [Raineya sp.]|nr:RluA family pseudouridine synthase [Raineya sp.]